MSQEFIAGYFTPLQRPELPGGIPPITLPPLPPGWGPPPILPPTGIDPEHPIEVPDPPGRPSLPPGFVWPPFDPSDALQGKVLLLCWIPGVKKFKWIVIDVPPIPGLPPDVTLPPVPPMRPQPK